MKEKTEVVVIDKSIEKDISKPLLPTYWIAYSADKKFVHNGVIETNQKLTTGLDKLETLLSLDDVKARYKELGVDYVEEV